MDCISLQDRMLAFLLEELPGREHEQVALHCRSCHACREEELRLGQALGTLYRLPEWSATEERRALALDRVRVIMKARGWSFPPSGPWQGRRLGGLLTVAGILILGFFLALRFLSVSSPERLPSGGQGPGGSPGSAGGAGVPGAPGVLAPTVPARPAPRAPTLAELCERGLAWARQQENGSRLSPEEKKKGEEEGAELARLLYPLPDFLPEMGQRLQRAEPGPRSEALPLCRLLSEALGKLPKEPAPAEREALALILARRESRVPFSPEVRMEAFALLARLWRGAAFPLLLDAYKGESSARVQWELTRWLGESVTPEEGGRLVELLRFERSPLLRYRLLELIAAHPPREGWVSLHEFLRHEDLAVRMQVLSLLAEREGKELLPELLSGYREEPEAEGRGVFVGRIKDCGTSKDRQALWEIGSSDPSPEVRAESWRLLYDEQPKAVADLLEKIFKQGSEEERAAALLATGLCRWEAGEKPLLTALRSGGRGRQYALRALASLDKPWVIPALEEVLRGGDGDERVLAAVALGRKGRSLARLETEDEVKTGAVRFLEAQVIGFALISPGLGEVAEELQKKYGVETRWRPPALRDEMMSWRFAGNFKGPFPVSFVLKAMSRMADLKLAIGPGYLEWTRESGERGPAPAAR